MICIEDQVEKNAAGLQYVVAFLENYVDVLSGYRAGRVGEAEQMRDELNAITKELLRDEP